VSPVRADKILVRLRLSLNCRTVNSSSRSVTRAWGCQTVQMNQSFFVLYQEVAGQRHGVGRQPFHCGIARRSDMGPANSGRDATFHFTLPTEVTEPTPFVFSTGLDARRMITSV
jgi:hypothetical protein